MRLPSLLRSSIFRLALLYAALFGASALGLLGFLYGSTVVVLDRETDAAINAEVEALAEDYGRLGLSGLVTSINERLASETSRNSLYLLADPNGMPMAGNLVGWPGGAPSAAGWIDFDMHRLTTGEASEARARARVFFLTRGFRVLVGRDLRERLAFEALMEKALVWSLLATAVLGAGGGAFMGRFAERRIETINRTVGEIMRGDLGRRVPSRGGGDEFDRLADNLNRMLAEIDRLLGAMREVTDNVAHDLRQPLTRLKGRLELALLDLGPDDPRRAPLESALAEADTLLGTFNALLAIARTEAATQQDMEPVALATVIDDALELYRPLAEEKRIALERQDEPVPPLRGNRHLLSQAIANLFDNAVKYTPEGGRIEVSLAARAAEIVVAVADSGPGIPAEDRERATRRFVRLDRSRSTPGNGLGLSLVEAVARLHGGRLVLADNAPGLRAELRFPVGPAQSSGMA